MRRRTMIGEWARRARREAGYASADAAASKLGFPGTYLRSIEAGHIERPMADRIAALEELYGSQAPSLVEPESAEEHRLAELLMEAYERGLREGLRIGRDDGRS